MEPPPISLSGPALPDAEAALGLSSERRDRVEKRIRDWIEGMTDGTAHDLDDMIDSPLRATSSVLPA